MNEQYGQGGIYVPPGQEYPAPVTEPPRPAEPDLTADMKKTYNRGGLFMLIVYGVMAVVSTVVLYLSVIPVIAGLFLDGSMQPALESAAEKMMNGDLSGYLSDLMNIVSSSMISGSLFIVLGIVIGSALGLGGGMLIGKLVLRKAPFLPPEKKKLSPGSFLFYLLCAYGLWGIGVFFGNWPLIAFGLSSAADSVTQLIGDNIIPYLLYAVIGAPVLEELACRKLLLDRLRVFGELPAAFVTALIFGLFHGNSGQFFLAFNLGLLFAVVYMKTGKIVYTMLLHAAINLTGSLDGILYLFGVETVGGIPFSTILFSFIAFLGVAGGIFLIVALARRSEKLRLEPTKLPGANRAIFKNPGMIIMLIFFTVNLVSTDFISLVMNLFAGRAPEALTILIPTGFAVALVSLLTAKVGTRRAETYEPVYVPAGDPAADAPVSVQPETEAPAGQNAEGEPQSGSGSEE